MAVSSSPWDSGEMYLVESDITSNVNVKWTSGAVLIGVFVNMFFYGLTFYQFVSYYAASTEFNDRLWIRMVVMSLLIIDTFQSCAPIYVLWYLLVKNYNNTQVLGASIWEYGMTPILDSVAAAITHVFLVHRIYRLDKRLAMCIPIMILVVADFVLGISVGVYVSGLKLILDSHTIPTTNAWLALQAFTDLLISAILCWIFWHSRTGNRKTDWALQTLLRSSIQTGLPAALVALATLLTYTIIGTQDNLFYGALELAHGRIYTLTLMDTLLVRIKIRREMEESETLVLRNLRSTMAPTQSESTAPSQDSSEMRLVRVSSVSAFKDHKEYSAETTSAGSASV